jgi:DNA-binding transcriptional MocR family regulator
MARTKNAIASPSTPKKTRMTEQERKASNMKHNEALMTLAIEQLLAEGYISVM